MNQIRKRSRYDEEADRIRAIVAHHPMPDFVTGFDVQLGEFDGDPALWVIFSIDSDRGLTHAERMTQVAEIGALRQGVMSALLAEVEDRFPYVRFRDEEKSPSTAA